MTRDEMIEALQKLPATWEGAPINSPTAVDLPVEVCFYGHGIEEVRAVRYIEGEHSDYILIS